MDAAGEGSCTAFAANFSENPGQGSAKSLNLRVLQTRRPLGKSLGPRSSTCKRISGTSARTNRSSFSASERSAIFRHVARKTIDKVGYGFAIKLLEVRQLISATATVVLRSELFAQ